MARRPAGLGSTGFDKIRENLGKPQVGQDVAYRDRPPLESAQPLTTGWVQVASSRLTAYNYDYSTGSLLIRWKNNGTVWQYENVSTAIFESFTSAPSLGRYVNGTLNHAFYHQVFGE